MNLEIFNEETQQWDKVKYHNPTMEDNMTEKNRRLSLHLERTINCGNMEFLKIKIGLEETISDGAAVKKHQLILEKNVGEELDRLSESITKKYMDADYADLGGSPDLGGIDDDILQDSPDSSANPVEDDDLDLDFTDT